MNAEAPSHGDGAAPGAAPQPAAIAATTPEAAALAHTAGVEERHSAFRNGSPDGAPPIDGVALARLYGEPLFRMPTDLYIPPDALEVFLETFEGPLDLLLYLIRRQNFNIFDIPLAQVTRQYLDYVEQIRQHNLELASEYLLMAAMLIEIKSRMLLPAATSPHSPTTPPPAWPPWSPPPRVAPPPRPPPRAPGR